MHSVVYKLSSMALEFEFVLVCTLLHRCLAVVFDFSKFHFEVEILKKRLYKNVYWTNFVDKCILNFLNNIFVRSPAVTTVRKIELRIMLTDLGIISSITKTRLPDVLVNVSNFSN